MAARDIYKYDLSLPNVKPKHRKTPKFKLVKNNSKINKKQRLALVFSTLFVFSMLMLVNYRYNVINEKNLQVQNLEKELRKETALVATDEINLEKKIDMQVVENYAKGQLGMQKPEKSQMIYVTLEDSGVSEGNSNENYFTNILEGIKNKINDIF